MANSSNNISLSISVKQGDVKARIAEINLQLAELGRNSSVSSEQANRLRQRLLGLRDAAKLNHAREFFNIRPFRDTLREISRVRAAYVRLKDSGQLTTAELGQAFVRLQERTSELRGEMNGIPGAWRRSRDRWP